MSCLQNRLDVVVEGVNNFCTPPTDDLYDLFPLCDLGLSRKIQLLLVLYDLVHVARWNPYSLHDLVARVSWVGYVLWCRYNSMWGSISYNVGDDLANLSEVFNFETMGCRPNHDECDGIDRLGRKRFLGDTCSSSSEGTRIILEAHLYPSVRPCIATLCQHKDRMH